MIRVLVADEYAMVRRGLRQFLSRDVEIEVVGEASSHAELLNLSLTVQPHITVMDFIPHSHPDLEALRAVCEVSPDVRVLLLTSQRAEHIADAAMQTGIAAYLSKDTSAPSLIRAIKVVVQSKTPLDVETMRRAIQKEEPSKPLNGLTEREMDVLRLLAQGYSNKMIAEALSVSEKTAKTHVSNILSKLELNSRTQAALYAARNGLAS